MAWIWFAMFTAGAGLVWGSLLAPLGRVRRDSVMALVERFWRRGTVDELEFPEMEPREKRFIEQARLAGVGWTYRQYCAVRWFAVAAVLYIFLAAVVPGALREGGAAWLRAVLLGTSLSMLAWHAPAWYIAISASQRRALMLREISKFAHRMSVCITEHTDLRELILRAGRPLVLLKPHIQKLAAQWGNDQREAILAFKDGIGFSEGYPLVNALVSLSRAKPADVGRLLAEHSRSIDATLESELAKRIENAPVWISFYVMIPFIVCLVLFVYPWLLTVLEQLSVSFG